MRDDDDGGRVAKGHPTMAIGRHCVLHFLLVLCLRGCLMVFEEGVRLMQLTGLQAALLFSVLADDACTTTGN
jgi:hypothetical protein